MTSAPCEFYADSLAQGRVTPRALLAPTGTITCPFIIKFLEDKAHLPIVRLAGAGWFLNIGYTNGQFLIQRNSGQIGCDSDWCRGKDLPEAALVSWDWNRLTLSFGSHVTHWKYPQLTARSTIVAPPVDLVRWVRSRELSAIEAFEDENKFLERAHSAIQRFEERLTPVLSREIFWDVLRKGNKVIARTPKRETDVQSALHAMLVDQMQLSNIDILPEARSAAGAVDFLLTAPLRCGEIGKLCVEFKNAHSADLISGLAPQLRRYMDQLAVANGAYCVLDYRDGNFHLPKEKTSVLIARLHKEDERWTWPHRPVKVHWLNLSKRFHRSGS